MRFVEVITLLGFNILIVMVMQHFHSRNLERRLKRVSQEIRELEDLVAAIIEEFEEVAGMQDTSKEEAEMNIEPVIVQEPEMNAQPVIRQEPEVLEQPVMAEEREMLVQPFISPERPQNKVSPVRAGVSAQPVDAKHQQVITLRNQGMDVADIARKLGIGRGEVNLILGLYQRS